MTKKRRKQRTVKQLDPKWKQARQAQKKCNKERLLRMIIKSVLLGLSVIVVVNLSRDYWLRVWKGKSRVVVGVSSQNLAVLSVDPNTQSGVLILIPDEMLINTAFGFGKYQAKSVAGLDVQEKKNGILIKKSLSKHMGILVDGLLMQSGKIDSKFEVQSMVVKQLGKRLLRVGMRNDLTSWDLVKLCWQLLKIREANFEIVDLAELLDVSLTYLPDGKGVLDVGEDYLDQVSRTLLIDETIAQQEVTVGIVNTAGVAGLGKSLERILSNIGFHVVFVESSDEGLAESMLLVEEPLADLKSIKRLEELLDLKLIKVSEGQSRVRVLIRLGEDAKAVYY